MIFQQDNAVGVIGNKPFANEKYLFVGKLFPPRKVVSGTTFPFHHVKVVLPGLIQDVSSILQGSLRFVRILDAIKEPI